MIARLLVLVTLAGCGTVPPFLCDGNDDCGAGVCTDDGVCAVQDGSCPSGFRYHPSAGPAFAETCVDATATPGGDTPDDPIALGESSSVDIRDATDDYTPSCGAAGGRDIFFQTTLTVPGRLYVDTFGTDFHVILAVHNGGCAALGAEISCGSDSCSAELQQFTEVLAPGTYCVIADQIDGSGTRLVVRSGLGPPSLLGQIGTNAGDSCDGDAWQAACSPADAPEQTWLLTSCTPTTFTASTCVSDPAFDGDLEGHSLGLTEHACAAGCPAIQIPLAEPGAVWLVAEAADGAGCGPVSVEVSAP